MAMIRSAANPEGDLGPANPDTVVPMQDDAESKLIRLAARGSHTAYAELVRRHQGVVRAVLGRFFRDDNDVDEVAQRTFVEAYRALDRFEGNARLSTWLVAIARRQAANFVRDESRRRNRESSASEVAWSIWAANASDQLDDVEVKLQLVDSCLKRLAPHGRQAVESYYFRKQSVETIAKSQDRSNGAVRMLLMRCRKALADCIAKHISDSGN